MATEIEFTLLAPYNETVLLQIDVQDWQDIPMQKDDLGIWRCKVSLEDGTYLYRYKLASVSWFWEPGHVVELIDPWATQVDEAQKAALIQVLGGERVLAPYEWQHDQVMQPDLIKTIAYELHIGEFGATGDQLGSFASLCKRLEYLAQLGVSAIQLMPVVEFPGDTSWGYNPAWPFAVESAYGTPADFKALVDAAHSHGIRVWTDMLFNHVTPECPLTWIDSDYWFSREPTDPDFNWGPEFNYDKHDENYDRWPAWDFAGQVVDHWIRTYHIDGIRYDAVKQLNHPRFLEWITQRAEHRAGPKAFANIAEHIPDDPCVVRNEGGMNSCWHDSFCHIIRDWLCGHDSDPENLKNALDARRRGYTSSLQLINYLSNHDQPRLIHALSDAGLDPEQALARYRLGIVILLTSFGMPMLRMGDEWAEARVRDDAGQIKPLDWGGIEREPGSGVFALHRELCFLRREHPALYAGDVDFVWEQERALAYLRSFSHEDVNDMVLVCLNLRDEPLEAEIPVPAGQWQIFASEDSLEGEVLPAVIEPWTARIWVRKSPA